MHTATLLFHAATLRFALSHAVLQLYRALVSLLMLFLSLHTSATYLISRWTVMQQHYNVR